MNEVLVREISLKEDAGPLADLDFSFASDRVAQVSSTANGLSLVWSPCAGLKEKSFPVQLDADPWQTGWVVEENGSIRGFAAIEYRPWNDRVVIWHFYVDRSHRRRGFGRLLFVQICSEAKSIGATNIWLETSNVNYAGVAAYQRLGFHLCGFDLTLYRGTPHQDEFGLYLAYQAPASCPPS